MKQHLIITICHGNIHRSVIAQLCLEHELKNYGKEKEFIVISRGIQGTNGTALPQHQNLYSYTTEYSFTAPLLQELGISIPATQKTTPINAIDVENASLILAMDQNVLRSLACLFPDYTAKMYIFTKLVGKKEDIADCAGSSNSVLYEKVIMSINYVAKTGIHNISLLINK